METVVHPGIGESSNCVIEEWKLFRTMNALGLTKRHHYGPGGMPNPAAVNCVDILGTIRIVRTAEGEGGYCVIDEWALYNVFHAARPAFDKTRPPV